MKALFVIERALSQSCSIPRRELQHRRVAVHQSFCECRACGAQLQGLRKVAILTLTSAIHVGLTGREVPPIAVLGRCSRQPGNGRSTQACSAALGIRMHDIAEHWVIQRSASENDLLFDTLWGCSDLQCMPFVRHRYRTLMHLCTSVASSFFGQTCGQCQDELKQRLSLRQNSQTTAQVFAALRRTTT